MGLIDDLKPGPVALDTQVFIYFIEESKQCLPLVKPLFEAIDHGSLPAATSGLTLMEVLVVPYRTGIHHRQSKLQNRFTESLCPPVLTRRVGLSPRSAWLSLD